MVTLWVDYEHVGVDCVIGKLSVILNFMTGLGRAVESNNQWCCNILVVTLWNVDEKGARPTTTGNLSRQACLGMRFSTTWSGRCKQWGENQTLHDL